MLHMTVPYLLPQPSRRRGWAAAGAPGPGQQPAAADGGKSCAKPGLQSSPNPYVKIYRTEEDLLLNIMNCIIL